MTPSVKKITAVVFFTFIFLFFSVPVTQVAFALDASPQASAGGCANFSDPSSAGGKYCLLTGSMGSLFPGGTIDIRGQGLSGYLQTLYKIGVAVATGLALIYITIGGLKYASTDAIMGKTEGKGYIENALLGLLVVLGSYVMLNAINPDLLNSNLKLTGVVNLGNISADTTNLQVNNGGQFGPGSGYVVDSNGNITYNGQPVTNPDGSPAKAMVPGSGGSGSIVADSLAGTSFPDSAQQAYLIQQIKDSGILDLPPPADAAKYFPNGQVTAEGYASLMAGIARSESDFNPNTTPYKETNGNISLGYFGLSTNDPIVTNLGYTTQQSLADPYHSIQAGVLVMKNQVQTTGTITGTPDNHYWGPLYRQANQ